MKNKKIQTNIKNTIYLLEECSKINFFIFRKQCIKKLLPDPANPLIIKKISIPRCIFLYKKNKKINKYVLFNIFNQYLKLLVIYPNIKINLFLVSIFFNRKLSKKNNFFILKKIYSLKKFFFILFKKKYFINFSEPIILDKTINLNNNIFFKLLRYSKIYFIRQKLIFSGPLILPRKKIFNKILKNKKIYKKINLLKEISADFSYIFLFITDKVLYFIWKKIYSNIKITGFKKLKKIYKFGNKVIYLPCHRSHIDYLLLSYIIYNKGIIPPHIVAGVNLSFWPIGKIFRKLGAFFIRRNFKTNKLYASIFTKYLIFLINYGYSIEYFIEGSRSRTGKLLLPKTGLLSIIIQSILNSKINCCIALVPVYIGYENTFEEKTYIKELEGKAKKKENIIDALKSFLQLKKLGQVYVNFGNPIYPIKYINNYIIKNFYNFKKINFLSYKPKFLNPAINSLANNIMVNINNLCAVNSVNLCAAILLSTKKYSLKKNQLIKYINIYINLLNKISKYFKFTLTTENPEKILNNVLKTNKILINRKNNLVYIDKNNLFLMKYYFNNIAHILMLPSLIANIIYNYQKLSMNNIVKKIFPIYQIMKNELFLNLDVKKITNIVFKILFILKQSKNLIFEKNFFLSISKNTKFIKLFAKTNQEIIQKYWIIFYIIKKYSIYNRIFLKNKLSYIFNNLLLLDKVNKFICISLNNNDYLILIKILKEENYIKNNNLNINKLNKTCNLLSKLLLNKNFCFITKKFLN